MRCARLLASSGLLGGGKMGSAHTRYAADEQWLEPRMDRVREWGIRVRKFTHAYIYSI
jgi:hypothetical protein